MAAIEIRAEFIRIARLFTAGITGVSVPSQAKHQQMINVYIEPHPSGVGVQIVSTDGAALCVQWDRKGMVDKPYLICGLNKSHANILSGATINDHWLLCSKTWPDPSNVRIIKNSKLLQKLDDIVIMPARTADKPYDTTSVYPDWRIAVPSIETIERMQEGFDGNINMAYLSILSRLYDDGFANCRSVRILSEDNPESVVLIQFPWRPDTFVVIARMAEYNYPDTADILEIMSTEPGDTIDEDDDL